LYSVVTYPRLPVTACVASAPPASNTITLVNSPGTSRTRGCDAGSAAADSARVAA